MGSNNLEEGMLDNTLSAFRSSNQDSSYTISPELGVILIDGWLQALRGDPDLDQLKRQLNELRTELQAAQPNGPSIRELMTSLADKTQDMAEDPIAEGTWTGGLESLSKILRTIGNQL